MRLSNMEKLIVHRNKMFIIDKAKLKPASRKEDIYQALYAAIYIEFSGAQYNKDYSELDYIARLNKLNEFAWKWLEERGLK